MRHASKVLVGFILFQGYAFGQTLTTVATSAASPAPEIEVVDGKFSMAVTGVPLSRLLSLWDRATGMTSKVKPELANRTISVRFKGLAMKDAVRKMFEGQPFNYMLVEGKGINVVDQAQAGGSTTSSVSSSSSPFQDSMPVSQPLPQGLPPIQPVNAVPVNATGQPAPTTPFGNAPNPNGPVNTSNTGTAPGQLPPSPGANNPFGNPAAGGQPQSPLGGLPSPSQTPPPTPAGPGTIGGQPGGIIAR